jgi:tRNA dimethylallyltransferase
MDKSARPPVIFLMGATASGKTSLAVDLVRRHRCEIVSVDSAMVYKGMDIGTAKPDARTLELAPHRLIDIREPEDSYSAGEFRRDALKAIGEIHTAGKVPLLVGGTMLYYRVLEQGIAELPQADPELRRELDERAARIGWPAMHAELATIDPAAAVRIQPADAQRIQRALEVYLLSGHCLSDLQARAKTQVLPYQVSKFGLWLDDRDLLHKRIEQRFAQMLEQGFVEEVRGLATRKAFRNDLPSMRAVGYRQLLEHIVGRQTLEQACVGAMVATRQLAKRQYTWMRSQKDLIRLDALDKSAHSLIYEVAARAENPPVSKRR